MWVCDCVIMQINTHAHKNARGVWLARESRGVEMSRVLLATINVLWLLLSPRPLLDSRVPSLFSFPLSELLSLVFGALLVICSALLLDLLFTVNHTSVPMRQKSVQQRQSGDLTFALFLILSSLWTTGLGIHASAVIVQNRLTPDDPLYLLVHDHLHRLWAHNMFTCGYFGLLMLFFWTEMKSMFYHCTVHGQTAYGQCHQKVKNAPSNIRWVLWSIFVGLAYTIVAVATHTIALTTAFYVITISTHSVLQFTETSRARIQPAVTSSVIGSCISGIFAMGLYSALSLYDIFWKRSFEKIILSHCVTSKINIILFLQDNFSNQWPTLQGKNKERSRGSMIVYT